MSKESAPRLLPEGWFRIGADGREYPVERFFLRPGEDAEYVVQHRFPDQRVFYRAPSGGSNMKQRTRERCLAEIEELLSQSPLSPAQVKQVLVKLTGVTDGYVADLNERGVLLDGTFDAETLELIARIMYACVRYEYPPPEPHY